MSDNIKLVQGDTRPNIRLTLRDADRKVIDVSTATVVLKFRALGTTQTLFTLPLLKPNGGTDGVVVIAFQPGDLSVNPGLYEGEIEIFFDSLNTQTIYDTVKFTVRAQFT